MLCPKHQIVTSIMHLGSSSYRYYQPQCAQYRGRLTFRVSEMVAVNREPIMWHGRKLHLCAYVGQHLLSKHPGLFAARGRITAGPCDLHLPIRFKVLKDVISKPLFDPCTTITGICVYLQVHAMPAKLHVCPLIRHLEVLARLIRRILSGKETLSMRGGKANRIVKERGM